MLAGCGRKATPRASRSPVTVAPVERRVAPLEIAAVGTVEALRSATVHAQVGGQITAVRFTPGDEVRAGQTLFEIDRRPLEAVLVRTRAILARDRAQSALAQLEAERAATLNGQQLVSDSEFDQKRATAIAARAAVVADSASVTSAELDLANASVRAPISGRAGDRLLQVGDLARANSSDQALVVIHQLRPVLVRFTVPERELPEIRRAAARTVRVQARSASSNDTLADGRLTFIDNAVDPASGTVMLKAQFDNQQSRLWPGAAVDVRVIVGDSRSALVVPSSAVTAGQSGSLVFVLEPDSTVRMQPVTVAHSAGDFLVISEGVQAGDLVVTDGQFRLAPGSRVQVVSDRGKPGSAAGTAGGAAGGPASAKAAAAGGAR